MNIFEVSVSRASAVPGDSDRQWPHPYHPIYLVHFDKSPCKVPGGFSLIKLKPRGVIVFLIIVISVR